jgi:hypothetical protein
MELFIVNEIVDDYDDVLNIRGVFDSYDLAIDVAKKILSTRKDEYTFCVVLKVVLNTTYKEAKEVAKISKKTIIKYNIKEF